MDKQRMVIMSVPSGSQYLEPLRVRPPSDATLRSIRPADVALQASTGDNIHFLFSSS
jgi:hypothetical protein